MCLQLHKNKKIYLVIFRLLKDILFLLLLFLALGFLADGLLPGIISAHLSFSYLILIVALVLEGIFFLGNFLELPEQKKPFEKKILVLATAFSFLLILENIWKAGFFLGSSILILALATMFFSYKALFEKE